MLKIAVLWLVSLAVVAAIASGLAKAQGPDQYPRVISGNEFGFRMEGIAPNGQPMGTIMVRVGGKWVEAGYSTPYQRAN